MSNATVAEFPLTLPLPGKNKDLIEEAASLTGQSLTDFAITTLLKEAAAVVKTHRQIRLSNRDRDLFLALLETDDEPSETLKRAAEKYKQQMGESV